MTWPAVFAIGIAVFIGLVWIEWSTAAAEADDDGDDE